MKIVDEDQIPEGAVQIHLYDVQNVLRPRGHMLKESIGVYLLERLQSAYESWTDPKYGDNPSEVELMEILHRNMMEEVNGAYAEFIKKTFNTRNKDDSTT